MRILSELILAVIILLLVEEDEAIMFIYENGLPVGYDHTMTNYQCRNECVDPDLHSQVEDAMLDWYRRLGGQSRVRLGKIGQMQGSEVNLKRLEHE